MTFDRRSIPEGAVESRWEAGDGHMIRRIDWPAPDGDGPARGSILFMPGRGDAYEKYLEACEHWRRQGWQVTAADWRGQAGSGRFGMDSVTGHIEDFALWIADIAAFWKEWSAERDGALVLAGHSMGGHLVLRAAAEKALSPAPDALILSTPMLGLHPQFVPLWFQQAIASGFSSIGDPRRPAWKWSEKPGQKPGLRRTLLTHDEERYEDERFWRRERPEILMGPGSWGWVAAAIRSIRMLGKPGMLEQVTIPVFLMSTTGDRLVSPRANRKAARRFPKAEFLEFGPEAAHEILREADPMRSTAFAAIDAFLDRNFPR